MGKVKKYKISQIRRSRRFGPMIAAIAILLILIGVGLVKFTYTDNLRPVSKVQSVSYFTVKQGWSAKIIGDNLKAAGLIRSSGAFLTYVRGNGYFDQLKHGTYAISPSMSVRQIVSKMVNGEEAKNLLTILPGKRLDQIQSAFSKAGYPDAEISSAFLRSTYAGDPAINFIPPDAGLEGFLYPDSFQITSGTPASTIVKESLDEMAAKLSPDIINGFAAHGLSPYQGVTLASIVYQESDDADYEPMIAQVFFSRISQNIALQSNVTANYASDIAGVRRSTNIDSPYNTYLHPGLPPGPIGNVTKQAMNAVAHPASTDYLYFVADEKTHQVYFAHTQAEQNSLAQQHCPNTCE